MSNIDFNDLPRDPEEAFLLLEERYRAECEAALERAENSGPANIAYTDYIAQVLGAIEELNLTDAAFSREVPSIEEVDYNTYQNFSKRVKHYVTRLRIRHGRRVQGYSVRFDAATKDRLRHYLQQMRELVDKCEVDDRKKEALFKKINALQDEVDRDRTRLDAFADLSITVAGALDTTLEPINKVLNNIAKVFHGAQQEEQKKLPPPTKPKQIEGPKQTGTKRGDMDDEIPF